MPSPFPGMNPYLEQDDCWHDFHRRFLPHVADLIVAQVRAKYIVKLVARTSIGLSEVETEDLDFIEIQDLRTREVITVIELLSLSDKPSGPHSDQYLARRVRVLSSAANFVEIDLLRCGRPLPPAERPECTYSVMVSRPEDRPRAGFWPIRLRDPLPMIPIPLRPPDPDACIDLQAIVHRLYDAARYERYIYQGSPVPPLDSDDAAWAQQFLPRDQQ